MDTIPTWYQVKRLPAERRCEVLAILLSPFADRETGVLRNGSPQDLLATVFRGQIPRSSIPNLVAILRERGILENKSPDGKGKGPWALHLPASVQHAGQKETIYVAAIHIATRELVDRFGKNAIPDIIAALQKLC